MQLSAAPAQRLQALGMTTAQVGPQVVAGGSHPTLQPPISWFCAPTVNRPGGAALSWAALAPSVPASLSPVQDGEGSREQKGKKDPAAAGRLSGPPSHRRGSSQLFEQGFGHRVLAGLRSPGPSLLYSSLFWGIWGGQGRGYEQRGSSIFPSLLHSPGLGCLAVPVGEDPRWDPEPPAQLIS